MATYDLDRTELNQILSSNIDPGAQKAVIDYLLRNGAFENNDEHGHGYGKGHDPHAHHHHHHGHGEPTVDVQTSNGTDPLDPDAQLLNLTSPTNTVTTGGDLKVIVENVAGDATLTVH